MIISHVFNCDLTSNWKLKPTHIRWILDFDNSKKVAHITGNTIFNHSCETNHANFVENNSKFQYCFELFYICKNLGALNERTLVLFLVFLLCGKSCFLHSSKKKYRDVYEIESRSPEFPCDAIQNNTRLLLLLLWKKAVVFRSLLRAFNNVYCFFLCAKRLHNT